MKILLHEARSIHYNNEKKIKRYLWQCFTSNEVSELKEEGIEAEM